MTVREDEIDGRRQLGLLLLLGQRRKPLRRAARVQVVDPHHALHGVDAGTRHEPRGLEENGSDAAKGLAFRILGKDRFT